MSEVSALSDAKLEPDTTLSMANSSVHSGNTTQQISPTPDTTNVTTDVMTSSAGDVTSPAAALSELGAGEFLWTWQMIVGVTCGSVIIAAIMVTVFLLFCWYRCHRRCCSTEPHDPFRFQNNSPQIWEDTVTLSYINAQFDLKDNSDEFASLENDTFLNSLESMMFHHTTWNQAKNVQNTQNTKL